MRPVNLIPVEERGGERAGRGGIASHVLLGGLAALLLAVVAVVLTGNSIADRKTERTKLEREKATAEAQLAKLGSYTQFKDIQVRREATVSALAKSRFDWERVMRELSLVLPNTVWLTGLSASITPDVQIAGGPRNTLRDQISGPALELAGCGRNHEAVALFLTRLENIDGVSKVAATKSDRAVTTGQTGATPGGSSCGKGPSFEALAGLEGATPPSAAAPTAGATTPASKTGSGSAQSGGAGA